MTNNKIIIVTGTPGAGKTTVLNGALEKVKNAAVFNYADVMLEVGKGMGLDSNHDAIRKLPLAKQRELQKAAAEKIAERTKGLTIVDTHCTIRTEKGYLPGLPEWVIKALNPSTIVLVEAPTSEIALRRKTDRTRSRENEKDTLIHMQQDINRAIALAYASLCGATVKIIENKNNKLADAVSELVKLLKEED